VAAKACLQLPHQEGKDHGTLNLPGSAFLHRQNYSNGTAPRTARHTLTVPGHDRRRGRLYPRAPGCPRQQHAEHHQACPPRVPGNSWVKESAMPGPDDVRHGARPAPVDRPRPPAAPPSSAAAPDDAPVRANPIGLRPQVEHRHAAVTRQGCAST
jgi:hypothetical protein